MCAFHADEQKMLKSFFFFTMNNKHIFLCLFTGAL